MIVHAFDLRTPIRRQHEKHSHKNWARSRLPLISFSFVVYFCLSFEFEFVLRRFFSPFHFNLGASLSRVLSLNHQIAHARTPFLSLFELHLVRVKCFDTFPCFFRFSFSLFDPAMRNTTVLYPIHAMLLLCAPNSVLLQSQSNLKANVEKCLSYLLSGFNCNEIYVMFAMPNKFLCAPLYLRVVILSVCCCCFLLLLLMTFQKYVRRKW